MSKHMPVMPDFIVMHDGIHTDYASNEILSTYVDFRESSYRFPITSLIKGCRREHAIELCKRIRISKPSLFRKYGEKLILDPSETKISSTIVSEKHNDPRDIADAQAKNNELSSGFKTLGLPIKFTTHDIKKTDTRSLSLSAGGNGWIFSSSMQPTNHEEEDKWWEDMPDGYNHITCIRRPREFAYALGAMVAEQLGPRGPDDTINHGFEGNKFKTKHKIQVIYHGPVTYEKDPFDRFCKSSTKLESVLLPWFIKKYEYKNQREYRFFIHTEEEPPEETVDLDVSLAMLGAMIEPHKTAPSQVFPTVIPFNSPTDPNAHADSSDMQVIEEMRAFSHDNQQASASDESDFDAAINDPLLPVSPSACDSDGQQHTGLETEEGHYATKTLRNRIEWLIGAGKITENRPALVKSSAWNADFCIRRLCNTFEDPIKNMSIEDTSVVIRVKFPSGSDTEGKILVGPYNANGYKIIRGNETGEINESYNMNYNLPVNLWMDEVVERLKESGLCVRQNPRSP